MMKKFLLSCLGLLPLGLIAQSSFTIRGYGKGFIEGDSIFLSYKQGDQFLLDSTVVKNNSFEFKGAVTYIVRGYVCRRDNPRFAEILSDAFDIYIEAGNIRLHSNDSLKNAVVSGTPLNNEYAGLVLALQPAIAKGRKIKDLGTFTQEELKDTALVNAARLQALAYLDETYKIQLDFIDLHPDSYVSLVTLARIARTSKYISAVERRFSKLSKVLQEKQEGKDISRRITESKKIIAGMMAVDFTQPDTQGKIVKLSDYKGKYVLVDFWASWCLPCREENPNVVAAFAKYKDKNFTVVSVSIDVLKDKNKWLDAVKKDKLPWTQVSDLKEKNGAAALYGITTIPANVLIDPSGKVIAKDLKGKDLQDKLATIFGS